MRYLKAVQIGEKLGAVVHAGGEAQGPFGVFGHVQIRRHVQFNCVIIRTFETHSLLFTIVVGLTVGIGQSELHAVQISDQIDSSDEWTALDADQTEVARRKLARLAVRNEQICTAVVVALSRRAVLDHGPAETDALVGLSIVKVEDSTGFGESQLQETIVELHHFVDGGFGRKGSKAEDSLGLEGTHLYERGKVRRQVLLLSVFKFGQWTGLLVGRGENGVLLDCVRFDIDEYEKLQRIVGIVPNSTGGC